MGETHNEKRTAGVDLELIPISEEMEKEMVEAYQSIGNRGFL